MVILLFVPLAIVAAVAAGVLQQRHGRVEAYRLLRVLAMSLAVLFAVFAGLFIAGETFADPGGAVAVALVLSWLVPAAALSAAAWQWPDTTQWVLAGLVAVVVAVGVWYAIAPDWWRTFEDDRGPVRAVAVFALSLPLALLAWHRPKVGGALLVVVGLVPGMLAMLSTGGGGASGVVAAASSPTFLIGALFLGARWVGERSQPAPA